MPVSFDPLQTEPYNRDVLACPLAPCRSCEGRNGRGI